MEAGEHPAAWTRLIRRMFRPFLTDEEKKLISMAIADMEAKTTGEIQVHVIARAGSGDCLELAKKTFYALGLQKTDGRNGVLILVAHLDHQFAIWGDEGIHAIAGQILWDRAAKTIKEHFAKRSYGAGIETCVREVGLELSAHFHKKDDGPGKNQLSNEVTES